VSGQVVDATDSSIVNPPLPPTATVMPAVEVSGSSQVTDATDTPVASPTLPPTATVTDIPAVEVPATATEVVEPTSTPTDIPTATPQPPANDWSFTNVQLYPDQYEEGLLLLGEMNNNSDAPQTLTEVTGIFYDAQGQVIADTGNTIGYWPVDIIPPGGRVPFELIVEGIQSAANFNLSVEAEPSSIIPRQDFEFLGLNQWNEDDTYCLTGQFHNPGDELHNYLVIGATLYDEQDNIVNFGDYFEPDLEAMGGDQPLEFEICIAPPNHGANRYELWAWGE
jgi:hypothetical protein